jgi:hypothetical protein
VLWGSRLACPFDHGVALHARDRHRAFMALPAGIVTPSDGKRHLTITQTVAP